MSEEQNQSQDLHSQPTVPSSSPDSDAKMWAMLCHLGGLGILTFATLWFGNVIFPLIFWQMKKDRYPFVDDQGKEALNFQISMMLYMLVAGLTCIGLILIPVIIIVDVIFTIIAAIKANNGETYRYPLTIRFIK